MHLDVAKRFLRGNSISVAGVIGVVFPLNR